ncbi:TolC family protein [Treponema sp.]|uniref:TolC family protein n=1 Tax=Treponema sp. TaxID=166 RepID=UPI0025CC1449|nr:TolC family protein [Treponema sp.]MCR5218619.1 TolC family protein [Treponema sp.]
MKKLFSVAAALIAAAGLNAESLKLTIDDSVKYALEGNLSIKQSQIDLDQAARSKKYSWNSISPEASLSASYSQNLPENQNSTSDSGSIAITGKVSLSLSANLATTIKAASLSYQSSEISYESACRTIELSVRKAFWALLNEKENIDLQEKNEATAKKQYESNLAKYNRGSLSQLDVLSAQVAWQNAKLSLESARTSWQNDMASFKQMLALPQDSEISLEGNLTDILELKEISLEGITIENSTIKSLQVQLAAAENSLTAARLSAYSPVLSAGYTYSMSAASNDTGSLADSGTGTLSFGATIPLDGLFPWSSTSLNIDSQKDSVKNLELELENQKQTLEVSIKSYMNQIKEYQSVIELRKSSIELAEQTYNMTLEAYNHGTKDLLSLQTANDALFTARVNLLSQAYTLVCAILDLENTAGIQFGTLGK